MTRFLTIIILLMLILTQLHSYSILERISGNLVLNNDARSQAMGSAGTAGGNRLFDSFLNPANLGVLPAGFVFQIQTDLLKSTEDRSLPMYNSFDAYSDDATYVSNTHYMNNFTAGFKYAHQFQDLRLAAGLSYRPVVDFSSNYEEEVRNNANSDYDQYPPAIAYNYLEGTGSIYALGFSTAVNYRDRLTLGLELQQMNGDTELNRSIVWSDWALDNIPSLAGVASQLNREFSAFTWQAGLHWKADPRLGFGLSFRPRVEFDVSGDLDGAALEDSYYAYYGYRHIYEDSLGLHDEIVLTDSSAYADYSTPLTVRAGVSYEPRNVMRTWFNLDVEYVQWSEVNHLYDDALNFYVGLEHRLLDKIPLRLGFNYQTTYALHEQEGLTFANKVVTPTFSVGSGFTLWQKLEMDFSCTFSNRQYDALDLFQDSFYDYEILWTNYYYLNLADRGWENPDAVNENFLGLQAALSYTW
ncbi:MAG: outer membrane protein transport protein [Candidatus Cloacimonetes bacterium]|nr:outer membrane protein transport protein [Candidatus Cloacimonadota bacterium]